MNTPGDVLRENEALRRELAEAKTALARAERRRGIEIEAETIEIFRTLMDNNPSLIFVKDEGGNYVYLNRAYEERFVRSNEWLGKSDFDFWSRESAELFRAHDAEVLASGRMQQFLEDSTDLEGSRHCWICYKFPITDSRGRTYVGGVGIDATERVVAQEALAESEGRLRFQRERMPIACIVLDEGSRFLEVNSAAETLFGFSREELVGRHMDVIIPQAARGQVDLRFHRLAEGDMAAHGENQNITKDGRTILCEWNNTPLRDASAKYIGALCMAQDITRRKYAEERLRRAVGELERSNRDLEQFAAAVSHDLKEPLRMVTSFTSLLRERYVGRLDATADSYMAFAADAAHRMQGLVDDLLAFARIGRDADVREVPAWDALREALAALRTAIEECDARVTVSGESPVLTVNRRELVQLFQNLIGNAVKFRREGVPPEIRIVAQRGGPRFRIAIGDNGIGIAPEYQARLFTIFERLHTQDYPGTGIGLAICKKIVEGHDGKIWAESKPGEGSTFYFTLPAAG